MEQPVAWSRPTHPWVAEGQGRVRFGVCMRGRSDWSAFVAWVQEAESLGFDSVWVQDHPPRYPDWGTTLAALATQTTAIRLGTLVSCASYRSPMALARIAADLECISNGRLILGVGIGDAHDEFGQMGIRLPSVRDRQEALEETLQIVHGLWGEEPFTYAGKHFQVSHTNVRRSLQHPHIPILIAGGGERVTLRQVAAYADVSNFGGATATGGAATPDDIRRKYEVLRRHCETIGRPYDSVVRSHLVLPLMLAETDEGAQAKMSALPSNYLEAVRGSMFVGTPDGATAFYRTLIDAGVQYCIGTMLDNDFETLRLLGQRVIPTLASV